MPALASPLQAPADEQLAHAVSAPASRPRSLSLSLATSSQYSFGFRIQSRLPDTLTLSRLATDAFFPSSAPLLDDTRSSPCPTPLAYLAALASLALLSFVLSPSSRSPGAVPPYHTSSASSSWISRRPRLPTLLSFDPSLLFRATSGCLVVQRRGLPLCLSSIVKYAEGERRKVTGRKWGTDRTARPPSARSFLATLLYRLHPPAVLRARATQQPSTQLTT